MWLSEESSAFYSMYLFNQENETQWWQNYFSYRSTIKDIILRSSN